MEPVEPVVEVVEEDWGFDLGIRAVEAAICRKRGEGRIPVESVEESVFSNFGDLLLFFAGQKSQQGDYDDQGTLQNTGKPTDRHQLVQPQGTTTT